MNANTQVSRGYYSPTALKIKSLDLVGLMILLKQNVHTQKNGACSPLKVNPPQRCLHMGIKSEDKLF